MLKTHSINKVTRKYPISHYQNRKTSLSSLLYLPRHPESSPLHYIPEPEINVSYVPEFTDKIPSSPKTIFCPSATNIHSRFTLSIPLSIFLYVVSLPFYPQFPHLYHSFPFPFIPTRYPSSYTLQEEVLLFIRKIRSVPFCFRQVQALRVSLKIFLSFRKSISTDKLDPKRGHSK